VTPRSLEVLAPGVQTAVQDLAGRRGLWGVGVPPSGAYDPLSFALANLAVGNDPGAAGLEAVLVGPTLRFRAREGGGRILAALTGACRNARLDGRPVRLGEPFAATDGSVLEFGPCGPGGLRGYLAVRGGSRSRAYSAAGRRSCSAASAAAWDARSPRATAWPSAGTRTATPPPSSPRSCPSSATAGPCG
jgi:allophanate hydrolase subunit 2